MGNPLVEVQKFGQSIWYDNIRRGLITSGELQAMVDHDGLLGITSNPAIFEKALAGGHPLCTANLDLFAAIYGAEAGNLALKCLAVGGVYVGGGIAPKILPKLLDGTFIRAFTAKGGRVRPLIPFHLPRPCWRFVAISQLSLRVSECAR